MPGGLNDAFWCFAGRAGSAFRAAPGLKTRPARVALISLEDNWTWSELAARTDRLAAHYLALGLKPGDRVASLMPNRLPLIAHYLACFKAGLVATPRSK